MRYAYPVIVIVFLAVANGCGGPAISTEMVLSNSVPDLVDRDSLPEQSACNIKVLTALQTGKYEVLEVWDSYFEYQKGSVTYRKLERKDHLAELRRKAGRYGANAIVVMTSDQLHTAGGVMMRGTEGQITELVRSDVLSREYVRTFAIYRQ